ncbi:aminoglycoside phosphotransferase family protein [Psychrobacillus lasiicapitis]|nr:aminoglycoside phosphotransferase family protein [Psychrobacillus lasiicapitis]GGA27542.1 aminoglycoside phosphotransferase [Psychrobacillus lasiicapitis]
MEKPNIPFLNKCTIFQFIEEGFSDDEKWCVDHTYLLRISGHGNVQKLKKQAEIINEVHALDSHIPFVHEVGVVDEKAYMILDYISGDNGEIALPLKNETEQYNIGSQVGKTLKRLHSVHAPASHQTWEETWRNRVERLATPFTEIVKENSHYECVIPFIEHNLHLLKNRPNCVQHYDFHPGNILVEEDRFTGLIDMQKITYADPINEFYKMEYFNVPISRTYSKGVLDGYHDHQPIPLSFWQLHRLYAAIHIISAEVWGHEVAVKQRDKFQKYTRFTLDQFGDFKLLIPKWYNK